MPAKGKFKYGDGEVPMEMTYSLADGKMEDLGISVLGIISDGGETLNRLLIDDRTLLKIWYHYVKEHTGDTWEQALETLDTQQNGLSEFREAFFHLIVSFSPPQARKLLGELWEQARNQMKSSQRIKSILSSSESQQEPDSTSGDIL